MLETPTDPATKPLAGLRILVAEDSTVIRLLIVHHLVRVGAEVSEATDGLDARSQVLDEEAAPFDLVLMDMQMPMLDGYAATRDIRAAGNSVPILALTAQALDSDRRRCLEAGCDEYAAKPIHGNELVEACRRLLG